MTDLPEFDPAGGATAASVLRALRDVVVTVEAPIARLQGDDAEPDTIRRVLTAVGAPDLGDVIAGHNALTRAVAIVEHRGMLPDGEWAAVAGFGPELSETVDRLRAGAGALLDALDPDAPGGAPEPEAGGSETGGSETGGSEAGDSDAPSPDTAGSDTADGAAGLGLLGETLQLLVVVEDCLAKWHRLHLEHTRHRGRELPSALDAARVMLADHLERDGELLRRSRRILARLVGGPALEVVRRLSSARAVRVLTRCHRDLEDVREAYRADDAGWLTGEDPEIARALDALDNPLRAVGGVLGRGFAKVAEVRRRGDERAAESADVGE